MRSTDAMKADEPSVSVNVATRLGGGEAGAVNRKTRQAAASAEVAMPRLRQKASEFPEAWFFRRGGAGCERHRFVPDLLRDLVPDMRRDLDRRDLAGDGPEPRLPELDLAREHVIVAAAAFEFVALRALHEAEHELGRERRLVSGLGYLGVARAHRSRHPLSFIRPRRIQLFIVPSGTF